METDGQRLTVFFRDALRAAQDEVMGATLDNRHCGPSCDAECTSGSSSATSSADPHPNTTKADTLLGKTWDGELFKQQREYVTCTLPSGPRVLGLYLYTDATVLSSSGAVSACPLRMRIVNVNSSEKRWFTLVYIPQVETKILDTQKGQKRRSKLLQRILHVVFRTHVKASHDGAWLNLPGGGCVRVSPRAFLCICGQPEKRAVMCLKGSGCLFSSTSCTVGKAESCSGAELIASPRDVDTTVGAQRRNMSMGAFRGAIAIRTETEMEHTLNSNVPALAAWAGLGNGPRMPYRLPGFDRLHVRFSSSFYGLCRCT